MNERIKEMIARANSSDDKQASFRLKEENIKDLMAIDRHAQAEKVWNAIISRVDPVPSLILKSLEFKLTAILPTA